MEERKTKRGNGRPPGGHGRVALQKKLAEVRREKEQQDRLEAANVLSSLSSMVYTAPKASAEDTIKPKEETGDIDSSTATPKTRPVTLSAIGIPNNTTPSSELLASVSALPGGSVRPSPSLDASKKSEDAKNNLILAHLQNQLSFMLQAQNSLKQAEKAAAVARAHGEPVPHQQVANQPVAVQTPRHKAVYTTGGPTVVVPSVVQIAEARRHPFSLNPVQLLTVNKNVADALRQGLKRQNSKDLLESAPESKRQHIDALDHRKQHIEPLDSKRQHSDSPDPKKQLIEVDRDSSETSLTNESRESSPAVDAEKLTSDKKKDSTDTNLPLKKRRVVPPSLESPVSTANDFTTLTSSTLPSKSASELKSSAQIQSLFQKYAPPVSYATTLITGASDVKPQQGEGYRPIMFDPRTSLRVLSDVKVALTPDEDGDLPIHIAVVHENTELVKKFIDIMAMSGKSVDRYNKLQQTPLHLAVLVDKPDIVSALLSANANPNLVDRNGHSSIHLAINKKFHTCLLTLFQYSKYKCVMNGRNYEGYPPLHTCVEVDDTTSMKLLLQKGADINVQDGKAGRSVLFYATEYNRIKMVEHLIECGANTELLNYAGVSPMMTAQAGSFVEIAHALQRVLDEQKLPEEYQYQSRKIALAKLKKGPSMVLPDIVSQSRSLSQDVKSAPVSRRSSTSSNHSPIDLSISRSTSSPFQEQQFQYKQTNASIEQKIPFDKDRSSSSIIKERHTQLIAALEGRQVAYNVTGPKPNGKLPPVVGFLTNGDKVINLTEENRDLLANFPGKQDDRLTVKVKEEPLDDSSVWYSRPLNGNVQSTSIALQSEKSVQKRSSVPETDEKECKTLVRDGCERTDDLEKSVELDANKEVEHAMEASSEDSVNIHGDCLVDKNTGLTRRVTDDNFSKAEHEVSEKASNSGHVSSQENQEMEQKEQDDTKLDTSDSTHTVERGSQEAVKLDSLPPPSPTVLEKESNKVSDSSVEIDDVESPEMPVLSRVSSMSNIDECSEVIQEETSGTTKFSLNSDEEKSFVDSTGGNSLQSSLGFEVLSQESKGKPSSDNDMEVIRKEDEEMNDSDSSMELENNIGDDSDVMDTKKTLEKSKEAFDQSCEENAPMETDDEECNLVIDEGICECENTDIKNNVGITNIDSVEHNIDNAQISEDNERHLNDVSVRLKQPCDNPVAISETDKHSNRPDETPNVDHNVVNEKSESVGCTSDQCSNSEHDNHNHHVIDEQGALTAVSGKQSDKSAKEFESKPVNSSDLNCASPCSQGDDSVADTTIDIEHVDGVSWVEERENSSVSDKAISKAEKSLPLRSSECITDAKRGDLNVEKALPVGHSSCSNLVETEKDTDKSINSDLSVSESVTSNAMKSSAIPVQVPVKSKSMPGMDQIFKTGQSHTLFFRDGDGYKPIRIVIDDSEQSSAVIKRLMQASMAQLSSSMTLKSPVNFSTGSSSGDIIDKPTSSGSTLGESLKASADTLKNASTGSVSAFGIPVRPNNSAQGDIAKGIVNGSPTMNRISSSEKLHEKDKQDESNIKQVSGSESMHSTTVTKDAAATVIGAPSTSSDVKAILSSSKADLQVMQNSTVAVANKSTGLKLNNAGTPTEVIKVNGSSASDASLVPNVDNDLSKSHSKSVLSSKGPNENEQVSDIEKNRVNDNDVLISTPHLMAKPPDVSKGNSNKRPSKMSSSSEERINPVSFMEAHKKGVFVGKSSPRADYLVSKLLPNMKHAPNSRKLGSAQGPTSAYEGKITRVNPDIKSKLSKALQSPQRKLGQPRPVEIDTRYPNISGIAGNSGDMVSTSVNSKISGENRQQL